MYSGTTFRKQSGSLVGVHQKIDRIARRHLTKLLQKDSVFPANIKIQHFEGDNGPDGIKRKSPSKDEPWHFIDPKKPHDRVLIELINDHVINLTNALEQHNNERAAFEAAWLAHAIVDGLTPAHHYPLNEKIEELWGKPHHQRTTVKDKNIIKGTNRRDTFSKNWQYWGAGGVFTAHLAYELGVASTIAAHSFKEAYPTDAEINEATTHGVEKYFMKSVHRVNAMNMYDEFIKTGWTRALANRTRKQLIPEIIKTVTLAWLVADINAKGNN